MGASKEQFMEHRLDEDFINSPVSNKPITKKTIENQIAEIEEGVSNGVINPLEMIAFAKYLSDYSKKLNSIVKEISIDELNKNQGKDSIKGFELAAVEAGTKYNYSNTEKWVEIHSELKDLESVLKALKKPTEQVYGDEVITLNPPIKTSTTTINCKIPKE